jgi:hypothetical protein
LDEPLISRSVEPFRSSADPEFQRLTWKRLLTDGYTVVNERNLGVSPEFRGILLRDYFVPGVLRRYPGDLPVDRERARDVLQYDRIGADQVRLGPHDTVSIGERRGRRGPREFDRVELSRDRDLCGWVATVLSLVPPENRRSRGTFGLNLFRTRTRVVTAPHQDNEEFVIVYVVDKAGSGGETYLYDIDNVEKIVHHDTLEPGDLIIFDDSRFYHSATPLADEARVAARRDALVCTIDYPHTYSLAEN